MDNPVFQELSDEESYYNLKSHENVYLDLRGSSGYVREAEKLERNNSKINLQITLKKAGTFKLSVRIWAYSLSLRVLICPFEERINFKTQNLRNKPK